MADDNELRPIESDETYMYDVQTAAQQARARAALEEYYGVYLEDPEIPVTEDPEILEEDDDIPPNQSTKVDYYDNLLPTHRAKTSSEASRFSSELSDYATYYNSHIKKPGESDYQMPVSLVQPITVEDDGAERPNESNLVSAYDVAASEYSEISVNSASTIGTMTTNYSQKMDAANAKFDVLQSTTNSNGITKKFAALKELYRNTHTATGSGVTDRSKMSVMQAGSSDINTIKGSIGALENRVIYKGSGSGTSSNPAKNTVKWLESSIKHNVSTMETNLKQGIPGISDYNAMSDSMLGYIRQNKSYSQWKSDHGSTYSGKFTNAMMQQCWDSTYESNQ